MANVPVVVWIVGGVLLLALVAAEILARGAHRFRDKALVAYKDELVLAVGNLRRENKSLKFWVGVSEDNKAAAWDEGYEAGNVNDDAYDTSQRPVNPYRTGV